MPADETGKTGYCQPGGLVAAVAETVEESVLSVTREDIERVQALVADEEVTKAELVRALCYLCQSAKAAVDVAECRGDRLESTQE
ncbi:hypothetical protein AB0L85_01060 [Streptomyces sp. NPDC052051]|uniref:hypothetical protein n=1 Tax=Streptomyces sp. NPDC052051 TaxID=3154649 RepID=UPI00341886AA